MKKKRYPDDCFRKFKVRWCTRGNIERKKAGPTLDNYSPVVAGHSQNDAATWTVLWIEDNSS
jgi:hypothetical protein